MSADEVMRPQARLSLFGFKPTPATIEVIARTKHWRTVQAAKGLGVAWLLMPVVFFIPPHVPWVLAAFGVGIYRGYMRMTEDYTLLSFEGTCPKCGAAQEVPVPARFRPPRTVTCPQCRNDLRLEAALPAAK